MRIAIANAARNYGGQEAMAVLLAGQLAQRGHDILFLCRPEFPALGSIDDGVAVQPVLSGVDWHPGAIRRGSKALERHRSQVLLATTNKDMRSAALSAWWAGVPVVVRRAMARPLKNRIHYRVLYGHLPRHIIVNSRATQRILRQSAPWLPESMTSIVYNGIDAGLFRECEPADLGVPPGATTIGFVGRFVEWKGILTVADAWPKVAASLPDAHLVLVGEGEMEREARRRLHGTGRVHWLGFRNDVPAVMRALSILAFPSTMEGFGLAAIEAMAAAIPVVGANACALPELIEDGQEGLLVPPRDATALAEALVYLGREPQLRRRMGRKGMDRVARDFSLPRVIDAYESLLTKVVAT